MTVIQNCPRAAGLVWLWHTPQMAPQLMGNIIWATRFSGHVFPTVATTKHLSPQNVAWQISSTQSHPSFMTVWTSQATKQHRARGHQASLHEPQDGSWTLDTRAHSSPWLGWQMLKGNQIRWGLTGTNIVMNLYFIHKLAFFSCQIHYRSLFRLCFYELGRHDEKLAKQVILHLNTVLDMFTMVYFTPCSLLLFGLSISQVFTTCILNLAKISAASTCVPCEDVNFEHRWCDVYIHPEQQSQPHAILTGGTRQRPGLARCSSGGSHAPETCPRVQDGLGHSYGF